MNRFDDYLCLLEKDFKNFQLIVLTGVSGAGKSTYINKLLESNASFKGKKVFHIDNGRPLNWKTIKLPTNSLIFIDEVQVFNDLKFIYKLLKNGNQIICANHLPIWNFTLFNFFFKTQIFTLDSRTDKLKNYLRTRDISFSNLAVDEFKKEFKANYTDLEIILENGSGIDFDLDYKFFKKFRRMEITPNICAKLHN